MRRWAGDGEDSRLPSDGGAPRRNDRDNPHICGDARRLGTYPSHFRKYRCENILQRQNVAGHKISLSVYLRDPHIEACGREPRVHSPGESRGARRVVVPARVRRLEREVVGGFECLGSDQVREDVDGHLK